MSRYISNPHLLNGYKYDLRIYVLVTSYDPLRIYVYNNGLVRFATEKYTTANKSCKKRYIHLTNYAVNKKAPKFAANTKASVPSRRHTVRNRRTGREASGVCRPTRQRWRNRAWTYRLSSKESIR